MSSVVPNVQEIRQALIEWLGAGRQAFASAAAELKLPTTVLVPIPVVTEIKDHGTGFQATHENVQRNSLEVLRYAWDIRSRVKLAKLDNRIVQGLLAEVGESCRFWSAFPVQDPIARIVESTDPQFETAPGDWLIGRVLGPLLLHYVGECSDLAVCEPTKKEKLVDRTIEFLKSSSWNAVDRVGVAGLLTESALVSDSVTLRPMDRFEMGRWLGSLSAGVSLRGDSARDLLFDSQRLASTHLLEVRTACAKTAQPASKNLLPRFLVALQLLGFRPATVGRAEQVVEPRWLSHGRMSFPTGLPSAFVPKEVRAEDLRAAWSIAEKLNEGVIRNPQSSREVAIHRFHLALRRESIVDQLIDLTIALEALLLPNIETELSFRFRLNGALWIETDPAKRQSVQNELKSIYGVRSKLVHGVAFPNHAELKQTVESAIDLARRALHKAVTTTWPTLEHFNSLSIGLESG